MSTYGLFVVQAYKPDPMLDGPDRRRRKKRTSIEINLKVALEKSFRGSSKPSAEDIGVIASDLSMDREV